MFTFHKISRVLVPPNICASLRKCGRGLAISRRLRYNEHTEGEGADLSPVLGFSRCAPPGAYLFCFSRQRAILSRSACAVSAFSLFANLANSSRARTATSASFLFKKSCILHNLLSRVGATKANPPFFAPLVFSKVMSDRRAVRAAVAHVCAIWLKERMVSRGATHGGDFF